MREEWGQRIQSGQHLKEVIGDRREGDREEVLEALSSYIEVQTKLDSTIGRGSIESLVREVMPDLYDDPEVRAIISKGVAKKDPQRSASQEPWQEPWIKGEFFGPLLDDGLGRYRKGEQIGRGGQGAVYKCEDRPFSGQSRSVVAIKVYPVEYVEEGVRIRSVDHPSVVEVFDHGTDQQEGFAYIVQKYLNGPTLDQWAKDRDLRPRLIVDLMLKLCDGVEAIHRASIVHRDIKPSNIVMIDDWPVIIDFGISVAGLLGRQPAGTPHITAPEVQEGSGDTRVDIYGLGVILRFLIEDLPDERLKSIADKCLAQNPLNRYATTVHLENDLRAYAANRTIQSYRGGVLYRAGIKFRRSALSIASCVLIALVLAAGAAAVVWTQRDQMELRLQDRASIIEEQSAANQALTEQVTEFERIESINTRARERTTRMMRSAVIDLRTREHGYVDPGMFYSIDNMLEDTQDQHWSYETLVQAEGTQMLRDHVAYQDSRPELSRITVGYWWWLLARIESRTHAPDKEDRSMRAYRWAREAFIESVVADDPVFEILETEMASVGERLRAEAEAEALAKAQGEVIMYPAGQSPAQVILDRERSNQD